MKKRTRYKPKKSGFWKDYGNKTVFIEGLTDEQAKAIIRKLKSL